MTNQMFCTLRLNLSHRCHSIRHWRHLYFVVTVRGAIADNFMKNIGVYVDSRLYSPNSRSDNQRRLQKWHTCTAYGWNILLTLRISGLTAILRLCNSSGVIFPVLLSYFFSNLVLVHFGRILYIAFSVFYLGKGIRGMRRGTTSFLKTCIMAYVQICINTHILLSGLFRR